MAPESRIVVIVEDEPDTAEMFAEMMRLSGYEVHKTYGGKAGIATIVQERPDAVILDLMMPDLSGLDVLRILRRDPDLKDIPVIVVSAKSLPEDIQTGLDTGASVYLTKPVSFLDIKSAVEDAIDRSNKPPS
jgi:DNA-binding response OmpR family regulator